LIFWLKKRNSIFVQQSEAKKRQIIHVQYFILTCKKIHFIFAAEIIPAILTPTALPTGTGNTFYLLKVEFFQMVNSIQYPLRNEKHNAVAIIGVV